MPFNKNQIKVQGLCFFPPLFWKNMLFSMLSALEKKTRFQFNELFLELILVRDAEIINFNRNYMSCQGPTNVLSFPSDEVTQNIEEIQIFLNDTNVLNSIISDSKQNIPNKGFSEPSVEQSQEHITKTINRSDLGTLILSIDTLERESILYGQNPQTHAVCLVAHGLAHLLGYDHGEKMDALTEFLEEETSSIANIYQFIPLWSYCHG